MRKKLALKLGTSAALLVATTAGCMSAPPASLSSNASGGAKVERASRDAAAAVAARRADQAVPLAERAVAMNPRDAAGRATLGQAYLLAGRFGSAEASFAEAVTLDPTPRNRFNLVLAQIALGKWDVARETLRGLDGQIADADVGLATTLAGDREGGLVLLERAARAKDADAKARQNLALAYALAGRWTEAQAVAGQDLPSDQLAPRFAEWAKLAKPVSSWDQVAALLGVTPVADPGRPVALALDGAAPVTAVATAAPVPAPVPSPPSSAPVALAAAESSVAEPTPVNEAAPAETALAEGSEAAGPTPVVSPPNWVRVAVPPTPERPAAVRTAGFRSLAALPPLAGTPRASGGWVVQLGAFSQSVTLEAAWNRIVQRVRALAGYAPARSTSVVGNTTLHRLTLAGFANRGAAVRTCEGVKARGAICFVRPAAGDQPIQWAAKRAPTRTAAAGKPLFTKVAMR